MAISGAPKLPLFADYQPLAGTYDEFFEAEGQPRRNMMQLVRALDRLGQREFQKRQQLANSAFLNAGVTFSVYTDERGGERVFPFDLIPRVITASEWDRVERGLAQRVQALNLFLADVYGKQAILAEDVLPSRLVLESSGYLERLRGVTPPGGVYIHVAGIDLIRSPSGEFLVLEDNVRTPSGVSYVLENRGVMKRALPSVFKKLNVRSVDDYPTVLRDTLLESAPSGAPKGSIPPPHESPVRAVVLTPGPFNSAYFEHSFLAGRMGCELAYASDLFVRDRKVYLKTTAGPQQIHVIYRRIDDAFLDPEFFRADSLLGVAGLVSAYAAGNVTLANALGNGVADDKAIYPYVPEMIRFYLSEEPLLGQVQTYNLSRKQDLEYALGHLKELVVKAVDGSGGYGMLMGPTASESEIAEFQGKLRANPRGYIAQPRVELSAAPTWCDTEVAPRRVDLRPFVLTGKKVWVLPGGLCRVALKPNSYVVNSSQGGGSKDTWVLAADSNMISRVADSCFWLLRYIERAESCARLASVNRIIVLDAEHDRAERWKPVIVVLGEQARFEELVGKEHYHDDDDAEEYLTWNQESPVSIRSSLYWARENARMIREVISREMWETLNISWQWLTSKAAQRDYRKDRSQFYRRIRSLCAEFNGISDSTMLHEEPLDFMLLGMLLERANQTARLMDVKHHKHHHLAGAERETLETPWQSAQWVSQLKLCAAEEPFLKRHRAAPTGRRVAEFLLRDPSFPRSVLHCFERAELLLRRIEAATARTAPTASLKALQAMLTHLREAKIADVLHSGLHAELTRVVETAALVCDHLQHEFLDPTSEPEVPQPGQAQSQVQA